MARAQAAVDPQYKIRWVENIPFWGVHFIAIAGVIWLGWAWWGLGLAIAAYYVRMFGITGAYHRYFSHRTYKTSRAFQFLLGVLGTTCTQKGPLWWAAHHRHHHKYSDEPEDVHSVRQDGFYWSHQGWILVEKFRKTNMVAVRDLAKYPELRFLDRFHIVFPIGYAVGLYLVGGLEALLWGYFVSTMLLWHGTFTINSLSHVIGSTRYKTGDDSKNNWVLAIITMGEGWHNNHHYYQRSTRQGFFWWEIDLTYYILKMMSWVGLVWDLQSPPKHVRDNRANLVDPPKGEVVTIQPAWQTTPSAPLSPKRSTRKTLSSSDISPRTPPSKASPTETSSATTASIT